MNFNFHTCDVANCLNHIDQLIVLNHLQFIYLHRLLIFIKGLLLTWPFNLFFLLSENRIYDFTNCSLILRLLDLLILLNFFIHVLRNFTFKLLEHSTFSVIHEQLSLDNLILFIRIHFNKEKLSDSFADIFVLLFKNNFLVILIGNTLPNISKVMQNHQVHFQILVIEIVQQK